MGVNANFTADFSTFLSAINAADVAMADFGKGADTVGTKLNNMVDKFSGRALIQQANELVVAINAVGGATTLTTNEQAKLNATLDQAIQKYQALGETVPPQMQALADATKQASASFSTFISDFNINDAIAHPLDTAKDAAIAFATSLGPVGLALTAVVTAGLAFGDMLLSWGEQAATTGSALKDMSEKTGIAVTPLSNLSAAAQIGGSSLEQVSNAIFLMERNMAEAGPKVEEGFKRIGLSIAGIQQLSPDKQFLAIADGIKALGDPTERAAAAMEIFGRQGHDLLPLISKDLEGLVEQSQALGLTWTEQDAAAAEEFEQKSRALDLQIQHVKDTIGNQLVPALTTGLTLAQYSVGWFLAATPMSQMLLDLQLINAELDKTGQKLQSVKPPPGFTDIDNSVDTMAASLEKAQVAQANLEAHMDSLLAKTVPLTAAQQQLALAMKAGGDTAKQAADFLGVAEIAVKKYWEDTTKAAQDATKAQKEADAIAMESLAKREAALKSVTEASLKAYSFEGQIQQLEALKAAEDAVSLAVYNQTASEKDRMKIIEDMNARHVQIALQEQALQQAHAKIVNDQVVAELNARQQVLAAQNLNIDGTYGEISAAQKMTNALNDLHVKKQAGIDQSYEEQAIFNQYVIDSQNETNAINSNTTATDTNTTAKRNNAAASAAAAAAAAAVPTPSKAPTPTATPTTPSAGPTSSGGSGSVEGFSPGGQISSQYQLVGTDIWGMSAQAAAAGGRLAWDDYGNPYIYIPGVNAAPKVGSGPGVDLVLNGPGISVSGFADGGPVSGGTPILVGERGPELFVPSSSGSIIPNGGGVSVTANIYVNGTAADVARQVAAELLRTIKSGAQLAH